MRFEGKTVEDATAKACLSLEKTLKEISVDVIFEGKKGFLGIGSKPAIIEVNIIGEVKKEKKVENNKNQSTKQNNEVIKKEPKKDVKENVKTESDNNKKDCSIKKEDEKPRVMDSNIMELVEKYILEFTSKMGLNDVKLNFELDEELRNINVNIITEQSSTIIGKRGAVIDSIQAIVNVVFSEKRGGYWIKLDSDNYRNKRQKTIESLAIRSATTVKKYKRKVILDNLTANERRIIHSVLQKDNRIDTFSEGKEPYRKLIIALKRNK